MVIPVNEAELEALRENPYQRRAFPLPDLSVVVAWVDNKGAVRLTVHAKPRTLDLEETEGARVGPENPA